MSSFDPGGTEAQMIELIARLDRSSWSPQVVCLRDTGAWFNRVAKLAPCTCFPLRSFGSTDYLRRAREFAGWCRDEHVAIVHAMDLPANLFALPAAAVARVPVRIGTRRELTGGRTFAQLAAQRAAYSFAHVVAANSSAAAAQLVRERVARGRIAVIPNGLDIGRFRPRTFHGAPRRVVMVANFRPEKGHDVLIDASQRVLQRIPDARFECVGDGPERQALMARAAERGVAAAFSFNGHSVDVPARLSESDIFVLPSRSESFPNALLEAMASGLPAIGSSVGGICDLLDGSTTGLLVPPGDAHALGEAICRLMSDPSLAARLAAGARAHVDGRFSFERMVASFENLYAAELTRRGVAPAHHPELAAS